MTQRERLPCRHGSTGACMDCMEYSLRCGGVISSKQSRWLFNRVRHLEARLHSLTGPDNPDSWSRTVAKSALEDVTDDRMPPLFEPEQRR